MSRLAGCWRTADNRVEDAFDSLRHHSRRVAQLEERHLDKVEVPGSVPGATITGS